MICIKLLQHPDRDKETTALFAPILQEFNSSFSPDLKGGLLPTLLCESIANFLDRINAMCLDVANLQIRTKISTQIKLCGIAYEHLKFQEKLDSRNITLLCTTEWIRASLKKALFNKTVDIKDLGEYDGRQYSKVPPAYISFLLDPMMKQERWQVYLTGMISLLTSGKNLLVHPELCPETLLLDMRDLSKLQLDYEHIVTAATMMANISHVLSVSKHAANREV